LTLPSKSPSGAYELAPRSHNLVRLAELAESHLSEQYVNILAEMNRFAIAGRYPDPPFPLPTPEEARTYADRAKEVLACLMRLL
jgi:HEPN domain-containing protein